MDREQTIDRLWDRSNHGTRREDVVAAFEAGEAAERERLVLWAQRAADGDWTGHTARSAALALVAYLKKA